MLMPLDQLGIKPQGILHLGACTGEEADIYDRVGVPLIVWFECNPRVLEELRMNVSHRIGHHIIEAAVSNKDGEVVEFNITNNNASSSLLPLQEHSNIYPDIVVSKKIQVKTYTVDTLLLQHGFTYEAFDFANLDLQGAELLALEGMQRALEHIKWVYTEVNFKELYKGCALSHEITNYLHKIGFTLTRIAPTGMGWGDALYTRKQ